MALPHLIKHIYNYGSDEVIRRGKKIFATGNVELIEYDQLLGSISFRVKDDMYAMYYKVYINKFKDPKTLSLRCSCPYNLGDICRHETAALLQLQEMADRDELSHTENEYDQYHTVVKMKQIDLKTIRMFTSHDSFLNAEEFLRSNRSDIVDAQDERVLVDVHYEDASFKVIIQKNEERNFDTSCNCASETEHPLCIHKTIVLLQLLNNYGAHYFDSIRNWDKEKNKLLALYGYSLEDDIDDKFEFTYKDGKPFLRLLDTSIKRINGNTSTILPKLPDLAPPPPNKNDVPVQRTLKLGMVIVTNSAQYPYVQLDAIQGETNDENNDFLGKVEKLDLGKFINTELFSEDDKMSVQQLRKLLPGEVARYLNRNSPFYSNWDNIIHDDSLPEETKQLIMEYLYPKYQKIALAFASNTFVYELPEYKSFQTNNLKKISFSENYIKPEFWITYDEGKYEIECLVKLNEDHVNVSENESSSSFFFKKGSTYYLWEKPDNILLAEKFLPEGKQIIDAKDWKEKLERFVLPLSKEYQVHFNNVKKEIVRDIKPEVHLLLRESGDYLLFQLVFTYYGYEIKEDDKKEVIVPLDDKLLIIHRNETFENEVINKIASLHSSFIKPEDGQTLILKGGEVLKNNWFFLFIDATREMNIPVHGFDKLKAFKFNTAKPSMRLFISSETDWFDAKVEIDFGGQKISVGDVKKALSNKQQYVSLGDGTLGILPEEWLERYSLLFRVGEANGNDNLKVNKYHFNLVEDLYQNRDEEEITFELEERYNRLRNFENIKSIDVPEHLSHTLRPYQTSGFHWLNYLNEVQWGGILADDMGLGKTIQALSFLHHIKHNGGSLKALVVCPTTLMYNWENEIKKFTPSISYYIHHGGSRTKDLLYDENIEVIITTYGTLRSDIKFFMEVTFDYVILDESQAIKNPMSKVTKAACLIKAKNRLCLSGTPLQNNTFDIYAQMNFLNPGMLGSIEFFKQEFAYPIDKYGEKYPKSHLKKLLYPFILRRTKEQVAKDLPKKSEMILFCEMNEEQRSIYDAYRNDFRDKILGIVETQGIQKSQLTILQGLMKLRQICDSPAILKEEGYPNVSVKLDELTREIAENISNHKALVFSQFLGMLSLIKQKLDEMGIVYEYFDGSTTAPDRKKAINRFQDEDKCRVFLISLKAGGVGLNLTAADYVYIVDPWWNPAVEQQAIDRTHRIGQTKNIFAYRMICKDTVEDKILQLQEKKMALAADLITDDGGFVKALTKEDVEYLFS